MGTEWDAASYARVSAPQLAWGERVVERIGFRGDEDVIDCGCGTGRVTRLVAERVPRGTVLGIDVSRRMADAASEHLADLGDRVRIVRRDLLELDLEQAADIAVSTATFHWIVDHDTLFARIFAALRPGGRLVAQCGGWGNIAATLDAGRAVAAGEPWSRWLRGMDEPWYFPTPADTQAALARAGFTEIRAALEEAPTPFVSIDAAAEFLATVVLRHHLPLLPEDRRAEFARVVAERRARDHPDGVVVLDYVRLNLDARRPAARGADPPGAEGDGAGRVAPRG